MYPNPQVSFIIDPLGSGKLIKFIHPIDTRTAEQRIQSLNNKVNAKFRK